MNIYQLDRPKKGLALIINNLHTEQTATRNDVTKLEAMFKKINVQVEPVKINQDKEELEDIADDLRIRDMSSYNLFFIVVISHGLQGDNIFCNSGAFDIEHFVENLSKNVSMIGYPKILIFDCCRGGEVSGAKVEKSAPERILFGSDVFVGFATTKGYASATEETGSPFIEAFCNCIERLFDKESFVSIFQEIQNLVSQKRSRVREPAGGSILDAVQVPESRSTLRKQLYLLEESKGFFLSTINLNWKDHQMSTKY